MAGALALSIGSAALADVHRTPGNEVAVGTSPSDGNVEAQYLAVGNGGSSTATDQYGTAVNTTGDASANLVVFSGTGCVHNHRQSSSPTEGPHVAQASLTGCSIGTTFVGVSATGPVWAGPQVAATVLGSEANARSVAVNVTGGSAAGNVAVAGAGSANSYTGSGVAGSGTGNAYANGGPLAVSGTGEANGGLVTLSGTGNANANGGLVAVSGTGTATGGSVANVSCGSQFPCNQL